jgi:hypothetical protein
MICIQKPNIGIAILSTDRSHCLQRLLDSIEAHTTKSGLRVFVIDDSKEPNICKKICNAFSWCKFIRTGERIGVAKNTNYAMKTIARHPYKIIMNNDVEILRPGWEYFYFLGMEQTGIHHFCYQQMGLWGAGTKKRPHIDQKICGRNIRTIFNYPQGAILTYDQTAFETVGYFDANKFKSYGYAHWMWSFSVSESRIQPEGIHDIVGSNEYFMVHNELCSTPMKERYDSYRRNEEIFRIELQKLKEKNRFLYTDA